MAKILKLKLWKFPLNKSPQFPLLVCYGAKWDTIVWNALMWHFGWQHSFCQISLLKCQLWPLFNSLENILLSYSFSSLAGLLLELLVWYLHFLQGRSVHNTVMELRNICNHPYLSQLHADEVLYLQRDILGMYCSVNPGSSILFSLFGFFFISCAWLGFYKSFCLLCCTSVNINQSSISEVDLVLIVVYLSTFWWFFLSFLLLVYVGG